MILGVALCLGAAAGSETVAGVTSVLIETDPNGQAGGPQFYFNAGDRNSLLADSFHRNSEYVDLNFFDFRTARSFYFAAPEGKALAPGVYENAESTSPRDPSRPILSIGPPTPPGYSDETAGRFEVKQVAFDTQGALVSFWATFEQRRSADSVLLYRGEVRFNADVPVALVAPATFTAFVGRQLSYQVDGHAAQGNPVTLTATGLSGSDLPQGTAFQDAGDGTGRFEWTPDVSQIGVHWVALNGRSAAGETDTVYTRIEVTPDFDDFDHAIPIPDLSFQSSIDRSNAGAASDDPVCSQPALATVWYSYTPVADGRIQASVSPPFGGGYGAAVSIYSGERGALQQVACGDFLSTRADAVAGRTYHIMVGFFAIPTAQVRFRVFALQPHPVNDDFADATVVGALPFEDSVEMQGSDSETGTPGACFPGGVPPGMSVWYAFTPARTTRVTIEATTEPYPIWAVSVFTGTFGALDRVACHDQRLSFTARAGVLYHVMIGNNGGIGAGPGFGGNGTPSLPLHVSFTGRPPLGIGVSVARQGSIDGTGRIAIIGTARCSRPAEIVLSGTVRDVASRRGGDTAHSFETTIQCDGVTPWLARPDGLLEPSRRGTFKGGPAELTFHATGVPEDDPDEQVVTDGRSMILLKSAPDAILYPLITAPPR
jgi:hypothetical protein